MKVIFISASPLLKTLGGSASNLAMEKFKAFYIKQNPEHEIIEMNLNNEEVGKSVLTSNNFVEDFFTNGLSDKHIELLKNANKIVISSPMTNFNYPAVLKNYLDHILVAKKTFKYKYDGKGISEGLLTNLKAQLILTQGAPTGWYLFASHEKSLRGTLNFAGIDVVPSILIDGTKAPENRNKTSEEKVAPHIEKIKEAAIHF